MTWKSCKLQALLLVLFAVSLAHAEKHSDGTASLSGVVIGASGAAVAVHLEPETQSTVRYYDGYEAVPREDGSFSFTEIPPGEYRLTVEANSFVPPIPSGPPGSTITLRIGDERARQQPGGFTAILPADLASGTITLHTGEERQGVVIELTHKLSICGYVTHDIAPLDAWGRRIGPPNIVPSDTSITYYHFNPEFGVLDNETKFDTNKDGSFRITDLAPGTYYVNSFGTWYPGTSDFTNAKPVLVGPEPYPACDMDLQQISHSGCTMGTVSGTIQPYLSSDKNSYTVSLVKRNPNGISANIFDYGVPVMVDSQPSGPEDNSFQARACPGDYDVVLSERQHAGNNLWGNAPTQKIVFDTQQVTIASSGSSHVTFTPHAMASIEGEVRLDMVTKDEFCPQCQAIYVSILREGNGEFQTVTLSSGNRFDFHNVSPGEYQIFVTATRLDKVFLQSIMVDGVEGKGNHFTIPDAKFVSMAATLSGNLTQAAGHPSPDVRHAQHWQTEGMRPSATVAGKIDGDSNATYTVRLLPIAFSSNAEVNLTTQAGADGSFHFDSVPPGIYRLRAHDKDYIRFDYGAKTVEVRGEPLLIAPGAQIKDLTLNTFRHGTNNSICGHLTDSNGNSRSMRIWYRSTTENQFRQGKEVSSDNDGYFRIDGLLPGDYFLQTPDAGRNIVLSSDGKLNEAAPVHLEDGKNIGCGADQPLELRFPANGGTLHTITGSVTGDLSARLGDRFIVELKDLPEAGAYNNQRQGKLDADHKFKLENIPSGHYRLNVYGEYEAEPKPDNWGRTFIQGEPLRHLIATQLITVSDLDISDLALTQLTLPSVTGVVHIPHPPANWKDFKPSSLSLKLVPHRKNGSLSAPLSDKGDNLGEFVFVAADAGEYEIQIEAVDRFRTFTNVLYVASVKLNGKEVNPRFFTMPKDGDVRLEVELSDEFASVRVQVLLDTSFALPVLPLNERCEGTGHYGVALFPDPLVSSLIDDELKQMPQIFTAWSISDKCQTFMSYTSENAYSTLQNIPPGKYYAIAVGDRSLLSIAALIQGPITTEQRKLLNAFTSIAKPITLRPGENLEVKLTVSVRPNHVDSLRVSLFG